MLKRLIVLLAVLALVTGCGGSSLKLKKVDLAQKVFGLGNYIPQKTTEFKSGDRITLYVQVSGFASEQEGDKFVTWPIETIKVRNSKGRLIFTQEVYTDMKSFDVQTSELVLPAEVTLTGEPGVYHIEGIVEDGITGGRAMYELAVTIK